MLLTYLFHSGYLIETEKCAVVFDFYQDSEGAQKGVLHDFFASCRKPVYVLASHFHPDHYNPVVLTWKNQYPFIPFQYLFSHDIRSRKKVPRELAHFLRLGEEFEDENLSVKAYGSTDVGISFFVRLSGKDLFHAGDLNNWHWIEESTPQEIAKSEQAYAHELDYIALDRKSFDLVMFPVDPRLGRECVKGAVQFVARFPTRILCPMHFWENYRVSDELEKQVPKGCRVVHWAYKGEQISIE